MSGTTAPRVLRYLDAWTRAADAGHVPSAATLGPGHEIDLDAETLPPWEDYYDASDAGGRPRDARPEHAEQILARASHEERARVAAGLLSDPETRAEVVATPTGVSGVLAAAHDLRRREPPPLVDDDPLPHVPRFSAVFWAAVRAVDVAGDHLDHYGVNDVPLEADAAEAAERLRRRAGEIGAAVTESIVESSLEG
jgi:hypothetical protein